MVETYRELYFSMFRAAEQALQAIDKQNFGTAKEILIRAQQIAEEVVLSDSFRDRE